MKNPDTHENVILCVVGARPNFMKIAPVIPALAAAGSGIRPMLIHTGQHYDEEMKDSFFNQLGIPEPDMDLEVGSGSHAVQTAEIMKRFEPVVDATRPAAVLVVGDVNSTIACALVAVKKGIPVIHVEAGLRSYDRGMPEEINRILTDQLSDLVFTTERDAHANLVREGIDASRIHFVGNVMIDTLRRNLGHAVDAGETLARLGVREWAEASGGGYALLTLHRPSNVDDPQILRGLVETIRKVSDEIPLVFPIHPRTRGAIGSAGLESLLETERIRQTGPMGYLEMLGLMAAARIVLTDSGGIQEETTALGVPCVTLRENTERPITVTEGTNTVVGIDPARIWAAVEDVLSTGGKAGRIPELWDGKAAERIAADIRKWLDQGVSPGRRESAG